jgi:hypothetical protein
MYHLPTREVTRLQFSVAVAPGADTALSASTLTVQVRSKRGNITDYNRETTNI